eukprot:NODE_17176_length_958_cov_2.148014.p1 GENE.NODE_17176_length_958_cov_2.148014~~NODE_17176_length_958_cov_2.148014.p1  ORF type:complete len:312 (-),score=54.20 NODE_17176_length_958_cov_2.148014:21-956(-)
MLFKAHPDAVKEIDVFGMLPVHRALRNRAYAAVIKVFLKADPGEVKEQGDEYGRLPLHTALVGRASDAVIEMLLKAHPDAVKEKDVSGWLPLHWALEAPASDAVIEMLLKAHPDAAKEEDDGHGRLPLHTALVAPASDAVIEMVFSAHPAAAKEQDWFGMLPLHTALVVPASDAVIAMLFKEVSGSANLSTTDIASLLHSVSSGHASHCKFPRFFPIVSAGATTLGAVESVTSALRATCGGDACSLEEGLRMFRVWHHGGMLWKICIERTVGMAFPRVAANIISKFVCGECACELCCRRQKPRQAATNKQE